MQVSLLKEKSNGHIHDLQSKRNQSKRQQEISCTRAAFAGSVLHTLFKSLVP
jgi:hypothetical protein